MTNGHETPGSATDLRPSDHALAKALAAGPVLLQLPYRGHSAQIVATEFGVFGRRDIFGCYPEVQPQSLGQWTRFPGPDAAAAWCRNTVAAMLHNISPARVDRDFAVWHGSGWSVEIDLRRQRYTIAVGLNPGVTFEVLEARESADEPQAAVEARGWAWLIERMPESPHHWPTGMADEYCRRVLLATA